MNQICQLIIKNKLGIFKITFLLLHFFWSLEAFSSEVTPAINREDHNLQQVTSVSQLSDVKKNDWAFQALQSLAERYGCIEGDTNGNYRGRSLLTRDEFAAALNSCLNNLDPSTNISREDLTILRRLQTDFASELDQLQNRVNSWENRTAKLEATQFSTTTKLKGEILGQLGDTFGDLDEDEDKSQTYLGYRARLNFETSFSGEDLLRTRFESKDIADLGEVTGTNMTRLETDGNTDDGVELQVFYRFPWGKDTEITVGPVGIETDDIGEVLNPLEDSSQRAISRFGLRDPATLRGPEGAGLGIQHEFNDNLAVNVGYLASEGDSADPSPGRGIFSGSYSAIAQLLLEPNDNLDFAITYTRIYERTDDVDVMASTGSANANNPFGDNATSSNNFGLQFNWRTSSQFEFGGWFGYTNAAQERGGNSEATILNGALTFAFPDLFTEGNLGGLIVGIPPIVTDHDNSNFIDNSTSLHLEAIYKISVNENMAITPGVFVITSPNHQNGEPIWVGNIRTRFTF
ncbi:MAG: hypothetical protein RLZZ535_65 [Cyanobacteriota bacterium]